MLPEKECSGCSACMTICPKSCIKMVADKNGFLVPRINTTLCVQCGICEKVCPVLNVTNASVRKSSEHTPESYAVQALDVKIKKDSSSGGVFTLIAESVIKNGGVVFGAAFSEDFSVEHTEAVQISELDKLKCSKYVQSDLKDSFKRVKKYLEEDKSVLFCGTPCQVEGLLSFLKQPYEGLITVDFVCHGIPSPKAFNEYLNYRKKQYNSNITAMSFRDKTYGWQNYCIRIDFENGEMYLKQFGEDLYMKAFLSNISLRESCYDCKFKALGRKSDITIADCWGIDKVRPELNAIDGVSLVLVQSPKGHKLLNSIKRDCKIDDVEIKNLIQHNPCITNSVSKHNFRQYFFNRLGKTDFEKLANNCFNPSYFTRFLRKMLQLKDGECQWKAPR